MQDGAVLPSDCSKGGTGPMVEAVIFDMDGLMLDTERLTQRLRRQAHEELGLPYRELAHLVMGRGEPEVRRIFLEQFGPDFPYDETKERILRLREDYLRDNPVPVKPGLFPLLEYLGKEGIPAAVASSTYREIAFPLLERAKIAPWLSGMVFGDMVERSKPEPDIFLAAARSVGAEPERCVALEDSPNGILAAHRAGMKPVMVPDLTGPDEALEKILYGCVSRLDQVIILLEGMKDS